VRLTEALPWLLLRFPGFDVDALATAARLKNLQNRLGFVVGLAREVAEVEPRWSHRIDELRGLEQLLEPSRLAREELFAGVANSDRMRDWLRRNRSALAEHWNLLTDLKKEHLPYVG
jgi:hypothetical protein